MIFKKYLLFLMVFVVLTGCSNNLSPFAPKDYSKEQVSLSTENTDVGFELECIEYKNFEQYHIYMINIDKKCCLSHVGVVYDACKHNCTAICEIYDFEDRCFTDCMSQQCNHIIDKYESYCFQYQAISDDFLSELIDAKCLLPPSVERWNESICVKEHKVRKINS